MILARWIGIGITALLMLVVTVPLSAQEEAQVLAASIQSEINDIGVLVVHYPGQWVADDLGDGELALASNTAVLESMWSDDFPGLQANEVFVGVQRLRPAQYALWGITAESSPSEVVAGLITTADAQDELILGKVEEFDAQANTAGIAIGRITVDGQYYGIIVATITLDEQIVAGFWIAPKAEIMDHVAVARAMISRVEFRMPSALTQSATLAIPDEGTLTLYVPEGWVAETDDSDLMTFGSSPAMLQRALADEVYQMDLGEVAGIATILTEDTLSFMDLDHDRVPASVITAIVDDIVIGDDIIAANFGDPESFDAGGRSAAIAIGTVRSEQGIAGAILVTFELGNNVGMMLFAVNQDEVYANASLAREMAATLEFTPEGKEEISLPQSITATMEGAGEYTLYYPEGWVGNADDGAITIADSQLTLDKLNADEGDSSPEPGEVGVTAVALPGDFLFLFDVEEDSSMSDAIAGFAASIIEDEGTTGDFDEPEPFEADGKAAAMIIGTVTEDASTYGAILIAVEVDGGIGFIIAVAHPDDVDHHTAILRAMAATFEFVPE